MNYPIPISKKNMFTKILFSVVVLFELNVMTTGKQGNLDLEHSAYSTIIKNHPDVLRGETDFCINGSVEMWAAICRQVLIQLRKMKKYELMYLDYRLFTYEAAQSKCSTSKTVKVMPRYVKKYSNLALEMKHKMAGCPCRNVIVPKRKTFASKDYTQTIAISPHPTTRIRNPNPQISYPNPQVPHQDPQFPHQDPQFPHKDPQFPHQDPQIPHQDPQIPNQEPQFSNPDSQFPNPDPQFPNPDPQFPNPDPQFPNPDPKFPNPDSQFFYPYPQFLNSNMKFPYPDPQFPNPDPQFPNPDPQFPNPDFQFPHQDPQFSNPDPQFPRQDPQFPHQDSQFPHPNIQYPNTDPQFSNPDPQFVNSNMQFSNPDPLFSYPYPQFYNLDPQFLNPNMQFPYPDSQFPFPDPQFSHPNMQFSNPDLQFLNTDPQFPNTNLQFPNPDLQFSYPDPQFSNPDLQFSNPNPQFSNPNPQFSNPYPQLLHPNPQNFNVLVFTESKDHKYSLSDYYQHLNYNVLPHPALFSQPPPTSISISDGNDFTKMYKDLNAVLNDRLFDRRSNIVDKSDKYLFARLCLMISKEKGNQYLSNVGELCDNKPAGWFWQVAIFNQLLLIYPCSPSKDFIHPDFLNNPEVIHKSWNQLQNLYAVSRGPDNNSLILLKYNYIRNAAIIFGITEFIVNIYEEFLWEIQIPKEFEEICARP